MRLKRCILLLLFGMLFLSACGKETSGTEGEGNQTAESREEIVYIADWEQFEPDLGESMYIADELFLGDCLYYGYMEADAEGTVSYIGCKELLSQEEPVVREQGEGYLSKLLEGADGALWCIRHFGPEEGEESWWLEQSAFSGKEPVRIDITEGLEGMEYPMDVAMDEDGYLYILGGEIGNMGLVVLDPEGKCVRAIEQGGNVSSLEILKGKGVLLAGYGGSALLFNLQAQEPENLEEISSPNVLKLYTQEDGSLLFTDGALLKRYLPDLRETEEIVDLAGCNVVIDYMQDIRVLSDGRFVLLVRDWSRGGTPELVFLKGVSKDEVPEKTVLRLGTIMSDTALNAAVADFNKKNSQYQLEITEYYTNDWTEAYEKLSREFAAGVGVDLLDLRYFGAEVDVYVEKGILEDLTPYLENSEQVSREDFLPNLLETCTKEGVLYTIPDAFSIQTLAGRTSQVGEDPGWTREEFMRYAASLPEDVILMPYQSKYMMLYYLLGNQAEPFVDQESGISHLDSEDFRQYMEFANHYSLDGTGISYDQIPRLLNEGQLQMHDVLIAEMIDLQKYYGYFGEPVTYIGYPTVDGSCGVYFVGSGKMFGINSASAEKEAAWDFISMQLTRSAQQQTIVDKGYGGAYGFPSRTDVLEMYFEKSMEPNYIYDGNGEILMDEKGEPMQSPKLTMITPAEGGGTTETKYYASRPEEVEILKNLISSITEGGAADRTIPDMILEEANVYFTGQKSLDETIAVMQSRVQLYLDEKK